MNNHSNDNTQTHVLLVPGTVVQHYRIVEKIGAGGMGEVYLAEDTKLKRKVAIKFLPSQYALDGDFKARFFREAEATAKLNHPNIVTIYEVSEFQGRPFFVMELIEGQSLRDLAKQTKLDLEKIIELSLQICEGLGAAHDAKVVHRDIKPSNVVIDAYGRPKILDFGLAAIQGGEQLTRTGSTIGTFRYMSPEQVSGKPVDHRSDLFSFGIVLYELLTGRTPFERSGNAATLRAIATDKPEPIARFKSDVPDGLQQVIDKLLEKDCELRYQHASGVMSDLKRLTNDHSKGDARHPSIAVLPFANMSTDKDQEYFCDGIAEDILNDLAGIDGLKVVSRTSSFAFKGKCEDLRDVGRKLNAGTILEGSVRKYGDRLRITAQLIDVANGYHLWSDRYDRELDDVFAIQDEIAQSIVQALRVKLHPRQEVDKPQVPTKSIEAYEFYLQGRMHFNQSWRKGLKFATELFSRAIEKDPDYAQAYAGLAESLSHTYLFTDNDESNIRGAMEASKKALELKPQLAEAHASRGLAVSLGGQYEEAEEEFKKAIDLNPNLFQAYYHYARACFSQGKHEMACKLFVKASEVNPDDYQAPILAAGSFSQLGQPKAAREALEKGMAIVHKRLEFNPDDVRAVYLGACALVELGETERGLEWAKRANAMEPDDPGVMYNCACIHAKLNQTDMAMELLKKAVKCGLSAREWIQNDSDLAPIRQHPEYQELLNRIRDDRSRRELLATRGSAED
jgi:non-specific serine/threonine protein kinase